MSQLILASSSSSSVETRDINLSEITVPSDRLRLSPEEKVDQVAESIKSQGLLNPITVRSSEGAPGYTLVAGNNRLRAARKLGWTTIRATIKDSATTDDEALLAEIDENLIRAELTPAETADHYAKRKEIYERLHPETTHGGDRKSSLHDANSKTASFVADTAKKTGKSPATVARETKRGKDIPNVSQLRRTSLDKRDELDALGKLPREQQKELISKAKKGENVSAKKLLAKSKSKAAKAQRFQKACNDFGHRVGLLTRAIEILDNLSKEETNIWQSAVHESGESRLRNLAARLQKAYDDNSGETKTSAVQSEGEAETTHGTN